MASIWDFLDSLPKRADVSPEELAARRQGYADLYQGGLLARNRDQMPLSVQGAQATQDFLPVIGDALALGEAGEALSRGELAAAGLLGTAGIIGLVPGAGDVLAKPVMAAGRRAADIARRIEVDPNAFGSMGGNIRLRPQGGGEVGIHKSNVDFKDIDLSKSADNTFWMASPDADWSNIVATGSDYSHQFEISPKAKLATWDDIDKYSVGELEARGFDGVRMDDGGGDVTYQIWNTDMLQRLSPTPTSPAQEVAGLLSSGRVDEVTDEMLAKLTPKDEMELFELYQRGATGMDLPMDEASRMARARELGFDTDAYHGTGYGGFSEFRGAQTFGATDPADASVYARYGDAGQVYPITMRADNPERFDLLTWDPQRESGVFDRAREAGHDAYYATDGRRIAFNPANIRSRFARFDPRLAHLRNLSAGVGGLGLLSSIMPQEEQY